jgi:hypothetical protein
MTRRCLPAAVLALAWAAADARGQVALEWKFKEGAVFYLEENTQNKVSREVFGNRTQQAQEQRRVSRFTVKRVGADGPVLEQEVLLWTAGEDGRADDKFAALFKGARFTVALAPDGTVRRLDGHAELLKKIPVAERPQAEQILTPEIFKAPLEMTFAVVPPAAVRDGERWEREFIVPIGQLGTFKIKNNYNYQAGGVDGERIHVGGTLALEPAKEAPGDLPRVNRLHLQSGNSRGTVVFDRDGGRLVRYEMWISTQARMRVENMGNQFDVVIQSEESRTVRLLSKNPLEK